MKKIPLYNSFDAGELGHDMDAALELKKYYRGCRTLTNSYPLPTGSSKRVPGTVYVGEVVERQAYSLTVTKSGTGTGVVTSSPSGIACGTACIAYYFDSTPVYLSAVADGGSDFTAWSGDGIGETAAQRYVLMTQNRNVDAEFNIIAPLDLDFVPYDMCFDGTFLYLCGTKMYIGPLYVCKIVKLSVSTLALVASMENDLNGDATFEAYQGIKVDNGFLYVCGTHSGIMTGFVHKIPTDLSSVSNTFSYTPGGGTQGYFLEPEIDSNGHFVYIVGRKGNFLVVKAKLNVSDLTQVWLDASDATEAGGILENVANVFLLKSYGAQSAVEVLDKTTGNETRYLYDLGGLQRGDISATHIYATGTLNVAGNYNGLVNKISLADLSQTWRWDRASTGSGNVETDMRCRFDGTYVYSMGVKNNLTDGTLAKITDAGVLVTQVDLGVNCYPYWAMIQNGSYLYVAYRNTGLFTGRIQRRLKSTLEVG